MEDMKKDSGWTLEVETTLSEVKNILGGINKRLFSSEKNVLMNLKAKQ